MIVSVHQVNYLENGPKRCQLSPLAKTVVSPMTIETVKVAQVRVAKQAAVLDRLVAEERRGGRTS
jgi:hypothetical protein